MKDKKRGLKTFLLWGLGFVAVVAALMFFTGSCNQKDAIVESDITPSQFFDDLEAGKIESVQFHKIDEKKLDGVYKKLLDGKEHHFSVILTFVPDREFSNDLESYGVTIDKTNEDKKSILSKIFPILLPFILIGGIFFILYIFVFRRMMNPMGGAGGKNGSRSFAPGLQRVKRGLNVPQERFSDVAGIEEVKEEVKEIVDFLKFPAKYHALGAEMPKGVLMVGSPGTGKTLLAKALAGEAGVPFFSQSGSEFVEMFVGVGASRVRDLFDKAKKEAPAIIFIDEIDAIGTHRGAGIGGGHDEQRQTLNQILTEMDGFEPNFAVVVVAATNRPDILDPALLRPGRFSRRIVIPLPRRKGREEILLIHTKGKPLDDNVDLSEIARLTFGFSGDDLRNLCNEAAIFAVRNEQEHITMKEFRKARVRVLVGADRKDQPSKTEKEVAAYHESGHALVAYLLDEVPQLEQVSIVSRGMTGGITEAVPEEENSFWKRSQLIGQIKFAYGGRAAEEIVFGEPSTGAGDDLSKATQIARDMILKYGMSIKPPPRTYGESRGSIFLGKDLHNVRDYGEEKQSEIDREIEDIMTNAYSDVVKLLKKNKNKLEKLANALLEREELSGEEVKELLG